MERSSPARMYAGIVGATLLVAGIIGFFYSSAFSSGDDAEREAVLGILDVNAWHNIVHLASGIVGLLAYRAGEAASRQYALIFGVVYLLVAIYGFIAGDGEVLLGVIPVNTEDNILHLAIAIVGLAAYAASKDRTERRTATV